MNLKLKIALQISNLAKLTSRLLKKGSGEQISGVVLNKIYPNALKVLSKNKKIILISATNGKTTTTNMLNECVKNCTNEKIASNLTGANLLAGITSSLAKNKKAKFGIFETDERVVKHVVEKSIVSTIILGNLSRDQLDRYGEVNIIAKEWHDTLIENPQISVIANCLDPNIVYAAEPSDNIIWVKPESTWLQDAPACPKCSSNIIFKKDSFNCSNCDFKSPTPNIVIENNDIQINYKNINRTIKLNMKLAGHWNITNAALALGACLTLDLDLDNCLKTINSIENVQGRGQKTSYNENSFILHLAKNPAGYTELIKHLELSQPDNIIFAFNCRVADGKDPSWLWDVEFEKLPKKSNIITCGERATDISNRLSYTNLDITQVNTLEESIKLSKGTTEIVASYTQFYKNSKQFDSLIKRANDINQVSEKSIFKTIQPLKSVNTNLSIGLIYPDVLGTYGDRGNATVLQQRARQFGINANIIEVMSNEIIPENIDIYLFGGGEDAAQQLASTAMLSNKSLLQRRSEEGAVFLTICAGFQLFGNSYIDPMNRKCEGLEIFDATTVGSNTRHINELVIETKTGLKISGFENHSGVTQLNSNTQALGKTNFGFGNNGQVDGAIIKNTFGTYCHGPILARNPEFADHLLELTIGTRLDNTQKFFPSSYSLNSERIEESQLSQRDQTQLLKSQNTTN